MNRSSKTNSIAGLVGVCLAGVMSLVAIELRADVNYDPYTFTTFAGSGNPGSADGTGRAASFNDPYAIATDPSGNVYVADNYNSTIRKITPAGVVTTFAGAAGAFGNTDGTGSAARFLYPIGVASDSSGNLYVADRGNDEIRKITPAAVVTTFAGQFGGFVDGTGSAAEFNNPAGVAVDSSGNVYVCDYNNNAIRKITPAGVVTTLAGNGSAGSFDGTNGTATFNGPIGVAVDTLGNVYVGDTGNSTIRKITPAGVVTTLAGVAGSQGSDDGIGAAARFTSPYGVATDSSGNVYVADLGNDEVRRISSAGVVMTLGGVPGYAGTDDGTGSAARFFWPTGVALDSSHNLYVLEQGSDIVRKGVRPLPPCPTISVLPGTLPDSSMVPYSHNLTASGGGAPYTYAVTVGSLPTGLNLSTSGSISGTPTIAGAYNFTVQATDTNGCGSSVDYSVTISCPTISLSPLSLSNGVLGQVYNQSISAAGGFGPYTYAVTGGSLPTGFTLGTNGLLSGTAQSLGTNTFTVTAFDTNGCTSGITYALAIAPSGNPNDTNGAVMAIVSPHNMGVVSNNPSITVSGTAKDSAGKAKSGVALVRYSFNGAATQLATTANKFTNWTANVTLLPGWNTFTAQALDYRGNSTTTNCVFYFGLPTDVTGAYQGLFYQTNRSGAPAISVQSAGTLNASVNLHRVYSGKVYVNGAHYPIQGTFDLSGNSSITVSRASSSEPDLTLNLHMDWTGGSKEMTGTVSCAGEGWTSSLVAIWTFKAN